MKVIIVLGAAVWADGPSPALLRRCRRAAKLWHAGGYGAVIVCGGLGKHPPAEADLMAELLVDAGVSQTAIRKEAQSTTTFENLLFARSILEDLGSTEIMIVTDRYHHARARLVARQLGLSARAVSPSLKGAHIPTQIKQHIREIFAFPAYALRLLRWRIGGRF